MRIERWKKGRFWAVYGADGALIVYGADGALIVVTVYKKGALEVLRRLTGKG